MVVASLSAEKKGEDEDGDITGRVFFDGTNVGPINDSIRMHDQLTTPVACDI